MAAEIVVGIRNDTCEFMSTEPFLINAILLNSGIIFMPIVVYLITRATGYASEKNEPCIPSISRSWRDVWLSGWFFFPTWITILVMGNICYTDASVLAVMNCYLALLFIVYLINPSSTKPTFVTRKWKEFRMERMRLAEEKRKRKKKRLASIEPMDLNAAREDLEKREKKYLLELGTIHIGFAGVIFVSIFAVELMSMFYYYDWNCIGIPIIIVDSVILLFFIVAGSIHSAELQKAQRMLKGKSNSSTQTGDTGWPWYLDVCEICYSLMFGFTLMFVKNPREICE